MKISFSKEEVAEILLDFVSRSIPDNNLNAAKFSNWDDENFATLTYHVPEIHLGDSKQ